MLPAPLKIALRPAVRAVAPGLITPVQVAATDQFPFDHYLGNEKLGVVLCAIPKCGCSTTKYWFVRAIKGQDFKLPMGAIHQHSYRRHALERKPPAQAAHLLRTCVTFTIVRDPAERLASAYLNKFVRRALNLASKPVVEEVQLGGGPIVHDSTKTIRKARKERVVPVSSKVNYWRGITFREFVEYVVRTPNERLDPHWRPQADFVVPVKFDLIAPLERIGWAIGEVQRRAGISGPTPETREPKAARRGVDECLADVPAGQLRRRDQTVSGRSLYDDRLRELVRARYSADFELHGRAMRETPREQ